MIIKNVIHSQIFGVSFGKEVKSVEIINGIKILVCHPDTLIVAAGWFELIVLKWN